jgi:hypothetical protein
MSGAVKPALRDVVVRALSRPSVLDRQIRAAQQENPAHLLDQVSAMETATYQRGKVSWS